MVWFLLYIAWFSAEVQGEGGCRDLEYLPCIKDKALIGHEISTVKMPLPAIGSCQSQCFRESNCISYNLGPVFMNARSCDLNGADHSTRPTSLINKTGSEYCPIKNPCLSSPCPQGRLCTPDLAWNTFNCNGGGWAQWNPWIGPCSASSQCDRTRTCSSPAPQSGGPQCPGDEKETNQCPLIPETTLQGCSGALGMEDGRINNSQITASSWLLSDTSTRRAPWHARLNEKDAGEASWGGWVPAGSSSAGIGSHIQVDFGSIKVVTMVATQGRGGADGRNWVTKYSVKYSNDASNWTPYEGNCIKHFPGNVDAETPVTHKLEKPIKARHIRLTVLGYDNWTTLRMEFYGC